MRKNKYRTHTTNNITENLVGKTITVSGWVENMRLHKGVQFIDLRDYYGVLQITFNGCENLLDGITRECTVSITGEIILRDTDTINEKITTGKVELSAQKVEILGAITESLPFEIITSKNTGEDIRLKYRFLDLRNRKVKDAIVLRSKLFSFCREIMSEEGFLELQTPILSASSPEGARDYLIPSRKHHGKFYALPQAPQIFKQLYMVGGFEKYFQIAPCFRDEDSRADRTPGEFYQLDIEAAFVEQEDILLLGEKTLTKILEKFSEKKFTTPFVRLTYKEAMEKYGTDKPDLRNPLIIKDLSDLFVNSSFKPFSNKTVRGIRVPNMAEKSKTFFKNMEEYALSIGMGGLGYFKVEADGSYNGPIDKFLDDTSRNILKTRCQLSVGDVLYFIADNEKNANKYAGLIREEVATRCELIDKTIHTPCWIIDFPMYETDDLGKVCFSHNPFSMPQSSIDIAENDLLEVKAYQYDVVLDGVELASGAVRNHSTDIMVKAFQNAGYTEDDVKNRFGSLYNAFRFGAPPHAGMAFGLDRLLMILLDEVNIREVIAFPLTGNAEDLLLGAPSEVSELQLRETHINIRKKNG